MMTSNRPPFPTCSTPAAIGRSYSRNPRCVVGADDGRPSYLFPKRN